MGVPRSRLIIHDLLTRLLPRRFRKRHGPAIRQLLRDRLEAATTTRQRSTIARSAVADALRVVVRSWLVGGWRGPSRLPTRGLRAQGGRPPKSIDGAWRELWNGMRLARRNVGASAVVILTIGLSLGANVAIFAVVYPVLLADLPYDAPERIVEVRPNPIELSISDDGEAQWMVRKDFLARPEVEAAAMYVAGGGANLGDEVSPRWLRVTQVSPGYFTVLGVTLRGESAGLAVGRDPTGVVVSHRCWREVFGGAPELIGKSLLLNGDRYVVAGIAPPGVEYPVGTDLWVPTPVSAAFYTSSFGAQVLARLTPGAQARTSLVRALQAAQGDGGSGVAVTRLHDQLTAGVRQPLWALLGAAMAIFLMGCTNLTGIGLSRLANRVDEFRIRRAIGATGVQLTRQLFAEMLVLALAGCGTALLLAQGGARVLMHFLPVNLAEPDRTLLTAPVVVFAGGLTLVAALVIGLVPGIRWLRTAPARVTGGGSAGSRLQSTLVVCQVAGALLLVAGAGLFARTIVRLEAVPLGFETEGVLTFETHLPAAEYPTDATRRGFRMAVIDGLRGLPGITAVGVASHLPLSRHLTAGFGILPFDADLADTAAQVRAVWMAAEGEWFRAIGARFVEGTTFSAGAADPGAAKEVVLSVGLAQRLFGAQPWVGKRVRLRASAKWLDQPGTVVGVVEDMVVRTIGEESRPLVWQPLSARADLGFVIRHEGGSARFISSIQTLLREVAPTVPGHSMRTMREATQDELSDRAAMAWGSGLFGTMALLLATLGLYGVMAEGVARRRRELGIRLALGADSGRLSGMVIRQAAGLGLIGILLGIPLAILGGRAVASLLYGVAPMDPLVLAGATVAMLGVAIATAWIPARRAAGTDPAESLRVG